MLKGKNEKIGILTFHSCYNYGAVLQCTALCKTIKKLGRIPEVVNFSISDDPKAPGWLETLTIRKPDFRRLLLKILRRTAFYRSRRHFDDFKCRYCQSSDPINSRRDLERKVNDYAALIVGSDQIWNFNYNFDNQDIYLLNFDYHGQRIAYAPCCGTLPQSNERLTHIAREAFLKFHQISVRNAVTQEFVKQYSGISAQIVCDPVFLYDFPEEVEPYANVRPGYIFCYLLCSANNPETLDLVRNLKRQYPKLRFLAVASTTHQYAYIPWADEIIFDASPGQWMWLLKHSELVFTNSFHGAAFAAKNERPLLAFSIDRERSARFEDLQTRYGISHYKTYELNQEFDIVHDYSAIQARIAAHVRESMDFLSRALSEKESMR